MEEVWLNIAEFENKYQVSNMGNVRSLNFNNTGIPKNLKQKINKYGFSEVKLSKNNKTKDFMVARLVAQAFIPNPNNLPCVNHKDEDKQNNFAINLEWCDVNYNNRYSKAKKVLQYGLDGKFVREWDSVRDIVRELGFNLECITGCCLKKYKTSHNYIWRYKNTSKNFKLCYIDNNKAWFTNDFEHCWGDDFNDAPYEYNAGEPYDSWGELIEDNEVVYKRKYIEHPITLKTLYFETNDLSERRPCDGYYNSPYSVEDINKGKVAWLSTDKYSIQAGTTMKDFVDIILKNGGSIWKKVEGK